MEERIPISWLDEILRLRHGAEQRSAAHLERLKMLKELAPTWGWREVDDVDFLFEADLAGCFRVEVEGTAVYLYGYRREAWLEHWFEGPGEEGLRAALKACRAEVGKRIVDLHRVLG